MTISRCHIRSRSRSIVCMSEALSIRSGSFGRVALLDMDRSLVRHAHPHCHVLLKVDGADTSFVVDNRIAPLTDETAVLINAWSPHVYMHVPHTPRTLILALYIEPTWLAELRSNWLASSTAGFFTQPVGTITPRIRNAAVDLASAMVHTPTATERHEALLATLMEATIERFSEWRSIGSELRGAAKTRHVDWRIRKAIGMIKSDPGDIANIDLLADIAGMSRANFFRVFEASTGVTPRVFLNVMRLEVAAQAAGHSQESFKNLSDRLGFSSQAHFTRFFRDHTGVAPSQFRNRVRSCNGTDMRL